MIGIAIKIFLHTNGKIELQYTVEDDLANMHKTKMDQWLFLNSCNKMWQVIQAAHVSNTKVNAGASRNIKISDVRFIESGIVPGDAQIIDYTWQFVNKNGSPDRRYKIML